MGLATFRVKTYGARHHKRPASYSGPITVPSKAVRCFVRFLPNVLRRYDFAVNNTWFIDGEMLPLHETGVMTGRYDTPLGDLR